MTITPNKLFGPTVLTTAAVALYSTPINGQAIFTRTVFTNGSTSPRLLTVNVVRSGSTLAAGNVVIAGMVLSAKQAYVAVELAGLTLESGDKLYANSDGASAVNGIGSGWRQ